MAKNDFARINLNVGPRNIPLTALGFEWPPPEFLHIRNGGGFTAMTAKQVEGLPPSENQFVLIRLSMSQISNKDAEDMDRVARGAEYFYMKGQDEQPAS